MKFLAILSVAMASIAYASPVEDPMSHALAEGKRAVAEGKSIHELDKRVLCGLSCATLGLCCRELYEDGDQAIYMQRS
ncbi:hypothetical protein FALBO_14279 [Fusarium albosuccineum]|uniref:Uncharacterized protein n=1 Tax=Fusarium albosuccineum TaxID=1237068 RepID=A0A8H4P6B9_9HYPO|nr:hypothetical protein FALBO_14279 [Fusarium albosuccineum]